MKITRSQLRRIIREDIEVHRAPENLEYMDPMEAYGLGYDAAWQIHAGQNAEGEATYLGVIKEELSRLNEDDLPESYQQPLTNVGDDYSDMTFEDIRGLFNNSSFLDSLMTPSEVHGQTVAPKASGRFFVLRREDHQDLDNPAFKELQVEKGREQNFSRVETLFFMKEGEKYFIVLEV